MPSQRHETIPPGEPRLLEGVRLFNAAAYFESHEVWESLWHELEGEERGLLQGLIQIAAAYHHLMRGNLAGATYLYGRARVRLKRWLPRRAGLELSAFMTQVDAQFARLDPVRFTPRKPDVILRLSDG